MVVTLMDCMAAIVAGAARSAIEECENASEPVGLVRRLAACGCS